MRYTGACGYALRALVHLARHEGDTMARILLIDDNATLRALLQVQLEEAGHEVCEAASGAEGARLYRERGADLILCDLVLPDKDGLETVRQLCQAGGARVIAMTGEADLSSAGLLRAAEQLGAARSLRKPFAAEELLAAVRGVLGEG
jgi:DNA-binding response OmpR family regulator